MGIKLDWQVESERLNRRGGEDPEERNQRRMQRLRILLFTLGIAVGVCGLAAVIWARLTMVDNQERRELERTVQAETATLRVGDYNQFINIQRSAGAGWLQEQSARFKHYQEMKSSSQVLLTGTMLDYEIDSGLSPRARAVVEEVIDGVRYQTVWFYWRYPDGWRHVPPDFTFWGADSKIKNGDTTIVYQKVDQALAQFLLARANDWWTQACKLLACAQTSPLTIQIVPESDGVAHWDEEKPFTLVIPSPLAIGDRSQLDPPLPPKLEDDIARLMSERAVEIATANLQVIPTADAAWLRQATAGWLAGTFTGRGDPIQMSFIQSLVDHYGSGGLVSVLRALQPSSDVGVLGIALKQPLEALAVDWRTFFQWRLDVEKTLLARNDRDSFQALWDAANPTALEQMRIRMARPTQATPQVQAVSIAPGNDGVARATVQVSADGQSQVIIFRLVDGAWKRSA
jgi:hypothetical protein